MIKTKTGKILIVLIVSIIMFNFISPNIVFARATRAQAEQAQQQQQQQTTNQESTSNSSNSSSGSETNTNVRTRAGAEEYQQQQQQQQTTNQDPAPDPSEQNPSTTSSNSGTNNGSEKKVMNDKEVSLLNAIGGALPIVGDGIVGIFSILLRVILVGAGGAIQLLSSALGSSAGTTEKDSFTIITPDYILFNKLAITDINFFKLTSFGSSDKSYDSDSNPIKLLKENVAKWYATLRTLSMAILLVVLIYIGIRMVIASTGEDKAKYKNMLMSWLTSFAILFLLHYIILLVINVNNVLVNMIAGVAGEAGVGGYGKYVTDLAITAIISTSGTASIATAWVYLIIAILTLVFLIIYVKRMLTIAFLILISPIITITYSIDKVGDNKAQAFKAWMSEFLQNVLIQPFHCIIYVAFVSSSIKMLEGTPSIGGAIFIIITTLFIFVAEGMLKSIFGINSQNVGNGMATSMAIWGLAGRFSPSPKTKQPPTNVGNGKTGGNNSRTTTKNNNTSMVATNNINQSNSAPNSGLNSNSNSTTQTNKNTQQPKSDSEVTAERLLNPNAQAEDYESTMQDKTQTEKLADAQADDYDELMGNNDTQADTSSTTPEPAIPRQRIYGNLGNTQTQYKNGMKRQKIYGGLGTLPTQNNDNGNTPPPNNSAQTTGANNNDSSEIKMPDVKNNNPSLLKYGKSAAKFGGKVLIKGNKLMGKAGGAIVGATFAGLQGANPGEVAGAAVVGKHVQDNLEEKMSSGKDKMLHTINDIKIKNDEKTLATAFSNYKNGRDYDKGTDINQARNYLNMDSKKIKDIKDISEKQYVQALHAMRNIYKNDKYNDEDAYERVMDTMDKIIDKEIEPKNY